MTESNWLWNEVAKAVLTWFVQRVTPVVIRIAERKRMYYMLAAKIETCRLFLLPRERHYMMWAAGLLLATSTSLILVAPSLQVWGAQCRLVWDCAAGGIGALGFISLDLWLVSRSQDAFAKDLTNSMDSLR